MKLEDQVCLLQQAKKLEELGVIQESQFRYCYFSDNSHHLEIRVGEDEWYYYSTGFVHNHNYNNSREKFVSAFTVAELGVMLPSGYDTMHLSAEKGWRGYDDNSQDYPFLKCLYDTEAEARADMLIHLLENKTETAEEVNQRLTQ